MGIQAIQTVYNGYKFRSRLEARWAVFFDHMGIKYQYEPEGFHYKERLWNWWPEQDKAKEFYYLPDFYLPDLNTWVECKGGVMGGEESWKLVNFVARVGYGFEETANSEVFLAGDWFNNPDSLPAMLKFRKGRLHANPVELPGESIPNHGDYLLALDEIEGSTCPEEGYLWNAYGNTSVNHLLFQHPAPNLFSRKPGRGIGSKSLKVRTAYAKAKQARFEHGEKG